jgi:uncharacterized protein (TIGR02118 family)
MKPISELEFTVGCGVLQHNLPARPSKNRNAMFKFVAIYRRVDDEDALEQFFNNYHLKLGEQLPGLTKVEISRVRGKPGGESRFHMMVELYFDSAERWEKSLISDAGLELIEALKQWDDAKLITWFYADVWIEEK